MNWIKAIRPLNGLLLVVPMSILGFRLVGRNALEGLSYALVAFAIYSATIVWNDYCDRYIDTKKNKSFANDHAHSFLIYSICWWIFGIVADCWLWWLHGATTGLLVIGLTALGLLYTQAQQNALTKNSTVALWVSSLLLFPLTKGYGATPKLWWLFLVTALVNYGREVFKDLEDEKCDGTSKGTLMKLIGGKNASRCAGLTITAGSIISIIQFHWTGALFFFVWIGASVFAFQKNYHATVQILKLGIVLFLGVLFL